MQKSNSTSDTHLIFGLSLGAGAGLLIGLLFGNFALGMALGAGAGISFGIVLGRTKQNMNDS